MQLTTVGKFPSPSELAPRLPNIKLYGLHRRTPTHPARQKTPPEHAPATKAVAPIPTAWHPSGTNAKGSNQKASYVLQTRYAKGLAQMGYFRALTGLSIKTAEKRAPTTRAGNQGKSTEARKV